MSILNVNKINPVGSGSTITISGIASVTGSVTATGTITGEHHGDGSNLTGIPAGQLTGTVADARLSTVSSSKLSGALPALDGSALTGVGLGTDGSANTSGIITATSFVPTTGQLSHRNLVYNGAMNLAQRSTSETGLGASAGYFTLDRYRTTFSSTAGRLTMAQVADVHDGFANAMKLTCTTADTSIGSSEYFILQQKFEGQDLQQLKKGSSDAEEFTVSFYVKGNASATYVVEMYDLDNNRQVGKTFSVTTSWTRVVLTFPADTTGALDDDNNASLQLGIWLHAGSNYTSGTLATSWVSNVSAQRAGGITSFFDSTNRTFFLTGLQLEVGSVATPFEHLSFAENKRRCGRYCQRSRFSSFTLVGTPSTYYFSRTEVPLTVPMRAAVTGTIKQATWLSNRYFAYKTWSSQTNVTTLTSASFASSHMGGSSASLDDNSKTDVNSVNVSMTVASGSSNAPLPANGPGSNNVFPIEVYDCLLEAEL